MGRFGEAGFLMMSFCEEAWERIAPIRAAIYAHPFLHGLADGSLPRPLFQHYIIQDSHYLADYARVLALVPARQMLRRGWNFQIVQKLLCRLKRRCTKISLRNMASAKARRHPPHASVTAAI
jgi:TENA/THI-4/PQQC family